MRSLESLGKSRNMDIPRDPEGIYRHDKKHDEPLSFEEHMRELRKFKEEIENLPSDDLTETVKQNEEVLNKNRHLNSIGDFAKQNITDKRGRDILQEMDDVGSFGRQNRNLANEERWEEIEKAREKVLESFRESFNGDDNGPIDHNIVDDSKISQSQAFDKENKSQMDYIPVTDFSKKESISIPSLELEEPVSSMRKASPEDEAAYHEFQMEQILGQFFPKKQKHETIVERRETSIINEDLAGSPESNEKLDIDLANGEKVTNEDYSEKEQVERLKVQLSNYDAQIKQLILNMQPYMQIPKVKREISKVIEKNNEINSSQLTDSRNDYQAAVEAKQSLIAYLEQANKFINDKIGVAKEPS